MRVGSANWFQAKLQKNKDQWLILMEAVVSTQSTGKYNACVNHEDVVLGMRKDILNNNELELLRTETVYQDNVEEPNVAEKTFTSDTSNSVDPDTTVGRRYPNLLDTVRLENITDSKRVMDTLNSCEESSLGIKNFIDLKRDGVESKLKVWDETINSTVLKKKKKKKKKKVLCVDTTASISINH
eukprot:TRINITY_DN201_c0_g1_i4.p1 TRINITY_DN201_c0_g1~~TRINITY_DN201_c0_g1_i4.p1  ORF type:complete len:184 (+),score=45.44 TRINITY_DN201_c0_g1_i4:544-1095(+)